jgi:hypothetical protein
MKKFLTVMGLLTFIATPVFAQSSHTDKIAVRQSGQHSFAMISGRASSRVPQFDYRQGTSEYPYGPGYNFPYPDRPYGDPDHW